MTRKILHFFLGFLLWSVFTYYWYLVAQRPLNPHTRFALLVIGLMVLSATVFIIWWILHNLSIHRKLQRRKQRKVFTGSQNQDYLGRWMVVDDEEMLTRSSYIEIETNGEEKVFRTSRQVP